MIKPSFTLKIQDLRLGVQGTSSYWRGQSFNPITVRILTLTFNINPAFLNQMRYVYIGQSGYSLICYYHATPCTNLTGGGAFVKVT